MNNRKLEGRMESVCRSRLLVDRLNDAVSILKSKPVNGNKMYDIIYMTFLGPDKLMHEDTGLTEESKSHARNLLKEFGLYEYRDAHPSALSGGQKQRLAIACAIFSGRRILILDEPTSGLDGQNMRLIAEKLKSEARRGRTILVITHDKELIDSCCDNIVEIAAYPNSVSHGYFPSSSA